MRERDGGREEERRYRKRESVDESRSEVRFRLRKIVVRGFSCASVLSPLSSFYPLSSRFLLPRSPPSYLPLLIASSLFSIFLSSRLSHFLPLFFHLTFLITVQVIANSKNFFYIRITNSTINTYKYSLQFSFYSY